MTLRMHKRTPRLKTITKHKPFNINTQKLKGKKERFETNLKNRFEKLEKEVTASHFSEIVKGEATKLGGKIKKEAPVLSTEDFRDKKDTSWIERSQDNNTTPERKNYMPISLLSHMWKRFLMKTNKENRPVQKRLLGSWSSSNNQSTDRKV